MVEGFFLKRNPLKRLTIHSNKLTHKRLSFFRFLLQGKRERERNASTLFYAHQSPNDLFFDDEGKADLGTFLADFNTPILDIKSHHGPRRLAQKHGGYLQR